MPILLGAIADDFTGATDLANVLTQNGLRVVQIIDVPTSDTKIDVDLVDAVIIALKSRTNPSQDAISWSLSSLHWLQTQGVQQIFFKYCSTFDSTATGNIGPVADALKDALKTDFAFICPTFPKNGRTVYQGHLFVGSQLLSDSPMKDHPLTPMTQSNLVALMTDQSRYKVGLIPLEEVRRGAGCILKKVNELKKQGASYGVIDAISEDDLKTIGQAARHHLLLTGGSAVAQGLANNFKKARNLIEEPTSFIPQIQGRKLVLAGSCSVATRNQISAVSDKWPSFKIEMDKVVLNENYRDDIVNWGLSQRGNTPLLIYSSSQPEDLKLIQEKYGVEKSGILIEKLMGEIAIQLTQKGFRNLVVAGGETSGAVVAALNIKILRIGAEIDPGVPWTQSDDSDLIALALKAGNFGQRDFFEKAFQMLEQ